MIRPDAPVSEETTGTKLCPETKGLVWECGHALGEPTLRVELIGLGEDFQVVQHSPANPSVENNVKRRNMEGHTTHSV